MWIVWKHRDSKGRILFMKSEVGFCYTIDEKLLVISLFICVMLYQLLWTKQMMKSEDRKFRVVILPG